MRRGARVRPLDAGVGINALNNAGSSSAPYSFFSGLTTEGISDEDKAAAEDIIGSRAAGFFTVQGATSATQEFTNIVDPFGYKMTRGSTTGSDSNDPTIYAGQSEPVFGGFPGSGINYWETAAAIACTAVSTWTVEYYFGPLGLVAPPSSQDPLGGWSQGITQGGALYMNVNRTVRVFGGNTATAIDTVTAAAVPAGSKFLRARYVAGVGVHVEYTNDRDGSWTLLETVSAPALGNLTQSTKMYLGVRPFISRTGSWGNPFGGLRAFANGVEVGRILATDNTAGSQTSFTAGVGGTVQAVRPTTGLKTIWIPAGKSVAQTDGTDDYFQLPASCTPTVTKSSGGETVLVAMRRYGSGGSTKTVYSTESANLNGIRAEILVGTRSRVYVGTGTSSTNASHLANTVDNSFFVTGFRVDGAAGLANPWDSSDGGYDTPTDISTLTGTITHTAPRLGTRSYSVLSPLNADVVAVAVFHTALSDVDTQTVSDYLESLV